MANEPGRFVWYELMTTDTTAAEAFYRAVIHWEIKDSGMPDRYYAILSMGSSMIGGLMALPPDAQGMPPCWVGYIGVPDVDAYAGRVTAAGGTIMRPPADIPGIGRFAVAADPGGAAFVLFSGMAGQTPPPVAPGALGHVGWHELYAADGPAAWEFYSSLFGWGNADAMDMGPMGKYQMFTTGDAPAGGIMTRPPGVPMPFWTYYFNVESADAAAARVTGNGGKILNGPMEVPGGQWILQCMDPQGAAFAMVAPKR